MKQVRRIEKIRDRTADSRCDEGFIHLKRYVLMNQYDDGSESMEYPCDIVRRRCVDAVAVILYYREKHSGRIMVGLRRGIRPPLYFRSERTPPIVDRDDYRMFLEAVAGAIEEEDVGWEGVRNRAAVEVREEAGFLVRPEEVIPLGKGGLFSSPGVSDEKVYCVAVQVDPALQKEPDTDGSPMEEAGALVFLSLDQALAMSWNGELEDAKTDICLYRLAQHLNLMKING